MQRTRTVGNEFLKNTPAYEALTATPVRPQPSRSGI